MYVPIPEGNWSEGLPVEFTKNDGTKWVANIAQGEESFNYINELNNSTEILIISGGCCYIIDRNKEKAVYDLVGPICETGDFLGKNRELAIAPEDYLAVRSAGAYGFAMASNYNSRARAAEILVDDSAVHLVRKRETIEQLFENESIPE